MAQVYPIDFSALAQSLLPDALSLVRQWLPNGRLSGREWTLGNLRGDKGSSLLINIDTGRWADFEAGEKGGDLISLYAAIHGITQLDAARSLSNNTQKKLESNETYTPDFECPNIPPHPKHGKPAKTWVYTNSGGGIVGYVCRFEPQGERKQFAPLSCWTYPDGRIVWKWKKWPVKSPLLYASQIAKNLEAKILVVEGEKTCDAAQKLMPDGWIVTTWCGGASSVNNNNWEILRDRHIWIWPDNDDAGRKAANDLKIILNHLNIVNIPEGLPLAWDLADAAPGYDVLTQLEKPKEQKQEAKSGALVPFKHIINHRPLATIENLNVMLSNRGVSCKYNVISKRIEFSIPGEELTVENGDEAAIAIIHSYMREAQMSVDFFKPYLLRLADKSQYNPALNWIRSKPWDGVSRLQNLYDTIQSPETEAKELLIRRWLITAVHMALSEGIDSAGCLVLQGPQDIGKTWWVKKLVSEDVRKELVRTDAMVDPKDKDSVSQVISYWLVELGEIGATFRKADIDSLKAFITRDHDTMRRPYGEGDKRYPRRTALVASVDQFIYLHDTAGNRRFWTIPCISIDSHHTIDMQQLWAEVLELVEVHGESWQLEPDEKEHIRRINQTHSQIDPIEEMIIEKFDPHFEGGVRGWKTATQIARELDIKNIGKAETRTITNFLRKTGVREKISRGYTQFLI